MDETLSLETLCGGAVTEKFNRALRKVSENILDPNTEVKPKREIVLKVTLSVDEEDREDVAVTASVTTKLAPEIGAITQVYLTQDLTNGVITATEYTKGQIRGQLSLNDLGEMLGKDDLSKTQEDVIDFRTAREG